MSRISKEMKTKIAKMKKLQEQYKKIFEEVKAELIEMTDEECFEMYINDTLIDTTQIGTNLDNGIRLIEEHLSLY